MTKDKKEAKQKEMEQLNQESHKLLHQDYVRQDPVETMQAMLENLENIIWQTVDAGKKRILNRDFYIVISTKREPLHPNIYRNLVWYRVSCPTPTYDNTVLKYHYQDDFLEELWVIPDKETVSLYKNNALMVDPTEKQLLQYVYDFEDGTLLKRCKFYNHETDETAQLIIH